jgi:hypothetical protein
MIAKGAGCHWKPGRLVSETAHYRHLYRIEQPEICLLTQSMRDTSLSLLSLAKRSSQALEGSLLCRSPSELKRVKSNKP